MRIARATTATILSSILVVHRAHAFVSSSSLTTKTTTATPPSSSCLLAVNNNGQDTLPLTPLAQKGDWYAYLDSDNTGLVYYFNAATGDALWEPPFDDFPKVRLTPEQLQVSNVKQEEYNKNNQRSQSQPKEERDGGLFFGFGAKKQSATTTNAAVVTEERTVAETPKDDSGFFGFGKKKVVETQPPVEEKQQRDTSPGAGFLQSIFGTTIDAATQTSSTTASASTAATSTAATESATKEEKVTARATTETKTKESVVDTAPPTSTTIDVDMAAYVLPHPAKVRWGGEDAVLVKGRTFGVFDGVSGAEKLNGVPLYSVTLVKELTTRLATLNAPSLSQLVALLAESAEFANLSATGASTAVVGALSEEGDLEVLNLGDSMCVVIRGDRVVAKTREIVHYFDCPFQLSEDSSDRPRDGTKLKTKVLPGDVIVAGSDGVFDNIYEADLIELVAANAKSSRAAALARKIVDRARRISLDAAAATPYATQAKRNGMADYQDGVGGKVDDVSCVVIKCK